MNLFNRLRNFFRPAEQPIVSPEPAKSTVPDNPHAKFDPDVLSETELRHCEAAQTDPADALWLKQFTRRPIELLELDGGNDAGASPHANAICSLTTEEKAHQVVREYRDAFIRQGKYLYICDVAYNGYKVALISTTNDPYVIMQYAGTNGANYSITTEDIIDRYKKWDAAYGIQVIAIDDDLCECILVNPPADFTALADEVYAFCPDVVDQGTDTVEQLVAEIQRTGTIYLWWD